MWAFSKAVQEGPWAFSLGGDASKAILGFRLGTTGCFSFYVFSSRLLTIPLLVAATRSCPVCSDPICLKTHVKLRQSCELSE